MQPDQNKKQELDSREINPAEEKLRETMIDVSSKPGRKLKFNPSDRNKTLKMIAYLLGGVLLFSLLLIVVLGLFKKAPGELDVREPTADRPFEDNNNSKDYKPSLDGVFEGFSIDTSQEVPAIVSSQSFNISLGQQATLSNGFAVIATSIDRDFKPKSEFDYKKVNESGKQYIRVNLLIGNLSQASMPIGYTDLDLYLQTAESGALKIESQRITEGVFAPVDGQLLGSKQVRKISLHYIINKSATGLSLTKSIQIKQKENKKENIEKNPTLSLNIKLD